MAPKWAFAYWLSPIKSSSRSARSRVKHDFRALPGLPRRNVNTVFEVWAQSVIFSTMAALHVAHEATSAG
jgi:hypothetical protein